MRVTRLIVQTDTHEDACTETACVHCWSCPLCLSSRKLRATCLNRVREQQTQRPPERQNAGGICCRGWDEQKSSSKRQGLAGACPGTSVWGLFWPGGLQLGWGFSQYLNRTDVKVWWATGNHRNEAKETKGFHHTPCWEMGIHAIKTITLSTKTFGSATPSAIKSLLQSLLLGEEI